LVYSTFSLFTRELVVSSYYEALPISRAAMDLAVRIDKAVQCFARRHRYTLGAKLRSSSERVVVLVARANPSRVGM
jgi:hypothetical protein